MLCEQYKDALIEVAAAGAAPQGELRAHLEGCASCRSAFAQEQSLFATIDSSLHASANSEVPSSLLPRVRVALNEAAASRLRLLHPVVFASAGVALAFAFFLIARPRHTSPENVAKQVPSIVRVPITQTESTNSQNISAESTEIAAVRVTHSHAARNSTNLHSVASSNPEVLVPPDEREGLARLVAVLNERSEVAAAFVVKAPQKDAVVTADPLQIPDIEIKPLEGTETETSDRASERN